MISPMNKPHRVTSPYGRRVLAGKPEMHNGIDLIPSDGKHPAELFAVADGIVDDVRSTVPDSHTGLGVKTMITGNFVNIKTNSGYIVIYRHLKANSIPEHIKKGATVKSGDKIGVMGTTGQSTGVHLHYELRNPKGESFDPAPYIGTDRILPGMPARTADDIVSIAAKHAAEIIYANEGSYGTVVKDDNGALSIGKVQWHASRALSLMKTVVKANVPQAQNILGADLYDEIVNTKASSAWNKRTINDTEASELSALLTTDEGKKAQDELAVTDISGYVRQGMGYGLTDIGALIYFADGVNQYGTASSRWKTIAENALKGAGNVEAMFGATAEAVDNKYMTRRERVCKAVLALNLGGITAKPPETKPSALKPLDEIAREVIRGNWGNGQARRERLAAAGYDYATVQGRVNEMLK